MRGETRFGRDVLFIVKNCSDVRLPTLGCKSLFLSVLPERIPLCGEVIFDSVLA